MIGLGATYPGYLDAMKAEGAGRQAQTAADAGEIDFQGREALGRALFMAGVPGAQPMPGTPAGGPMPPPPGAPSMPSAPASPTLPGADVGGGMPGQASVPQPPSSGAPPVPVAGPQLDLQTVIARIQQANPGIKPAVLMSALERAQPILSQQAKQELAMLRMEFQQQSLEQRRVIAEQGLEIRRAAEDRRTQQGDRRLELAEKVADINAELRRLAEERRTAQGDRRLALDEEIRRKNVELREAENARRTQQGNRRLDQADDRLVIMRANQQRLRENAAIRNDAALQRLKLQREDMERKARQGDTRISIAQWRAVLDAEHKRTVEIIQTHTAGGIGVPQSEKPDLIAAANQMRDDAIARMQAMMRSGGSAPPVAPPAEAPSAAPAVVPPAAAPAAPPAAPTAAPTRATSAATAQPGQEWGGYVYIGPADGDRTKQENWRPAQVQ